MHIEAFPSVEQGGAMILFRGDDRLGLDPYRLEVTPGGRVRFAVQNEAQEGADVSAPVGAGRFVLVTATLEAGTGRMRLYQNGEVVVETTANVWPLRDLDPSVPGGLGIGNHPGVPASQFRYPFQGVINEVLLFNRALLPSEVRALYRDRVYVPSLDRIIRD